MEIPADLDPPPLKNSGPGPPLEEFLDPPLFADPNSRLHKPELRGYACHIYGRQVILLLNYFTVDKTVSAGLN